MLCVSAHCETEGTGVARWGACAAVFALFGGALGFAQQPCRLAVVSSPAQGLFTLATVDPATGAAEQVFGPAEGMGIAWSPNGSLLAYVKAVGQGRYSVYVVDVPTGRQKKVSADLNVGQFQWAQNSTALAIVEVREHGRSAAIYLSDLSPRPPKLVSGAHKVLVPPDIALSPSARYVCFRAVAADGSEQLIIADVAQQTCRAICPGMVVGVREWSPTEDILAVHARPANGGPRAVYLLKPPAFAPVLACEPGQEATGFGWSPSGKYLAYRLALANELNLYGLYELATGRRALIDGAQHGISLQWSPDGSAYAVVDGSEGNEGIADLKVGSVASAIFGDSWLAPHSTGVVGVIWHPQGKTVAFIKGDVLMATDCATRTTRVLADRASVRAALWSPDGTKIAIVGRKRGEAAPHYYQVWVLNPETGMARVVTQGFRTGVVDWSPDSRYLLLFVPTGEGALGLGYVVRADGTSYDDGLPYRKIGDRVHALTWYPR